MLLRTDWHAHFTYREGNAATHVLAHKALLRNEEQIWTEK